MCVPRECIAAISSAYECTYNGGYGNAILMLNQDDLNYFLIWVPQTYSPTLDLTSILCAEEFYSGEMGNFPPKVNLNCSLISKMEITENPLKITFINNSGKVARSFIINENAFSDFINFVEKIILNGIAVPYDEKGRCLLFNTDFVVDFFTPINQNLYIDCENPGNLDNFWESIIKFYDDFIRYVHEYNFPVYPEYPLNYGARASCSLLQQKVNAFIEEKDEKYKPVKFSDLPDFFDSETGRIKDFEDIKNRIYYAGAEIRAIPVLFPFLVNVFPSDSTESEREEIRKKLRKDFETLSEISSSLQSYQISNNRKLEYSSKIIDHDVKRTDRSHPAFKKRDGQGLALLERILKIYIIYNQDVGYVQGMNDIFVPIMDAFIPTWDENGDPYDYEGNLINISDIDFMLFWCYANFLEVSDHTSFLTFVSEQCKVMSKTVLNVIYTILPSVVYWIQDKKLGELIWCYSDYVLLFKRSFDNIWPVWIGLVSSNDPKKWISHFAASLIICSYGMLSDIENISITDILSTFPSIIQSFNIKSVKNTAVYLEHVVDDVKSEQPKQEVSNFTPEFFKIQD